MVKLTCLSWTGCGFSSQHPVEAHNGLTLVSGHHTPSSALGTHTWCTDKHAGKASVHVK